MLAAAGISWPLPEGWDEKRVEQALFGERLLALELYRENKVSLGRAAELCQTPLAAFMDFAAKHAVPPLRYSFEDLEEERQTADRLSVTVVADSSTLAILANLGCFDLPHNGVAPSCFVSNNVTQ